MSTSRRESSKSSKKKAMKPAARPKMPRSPEELVALFDATMKAFPEVARRKVFGYPCGFINGYMTVGLHGDDFFVRLPAEERESLLKKPGGGFLEPMPGRPMRDYVVVPESLRKNKAQLEKWVEKAILHARSLPPKKPKR